MPVGSIGRLLRPDIVHFHFPCLGTEIFLWELTLSNTLSFHFFIVQRHGWFMDDDKRLCHSKEPISIS